MGFEPTLVCFPYTTVVFHVCDIYMGNLTVNCPQKCTYMYVTTMAANLCCCSYGATIHPVHMLSKLLVSWYYCIGDVITLSP